MKCLKRHYFAAAITNMQKRILYYFILFCTISNGTIAIAADCPSYVSKQTCDVLSIASDFMGKSQYDSAQFVISKMFAQTEFSIGTTDLYYLHCYEAEIMYYNALFEQGLNSSLRGLEIAQQLKNDTLSGNSENLIGLFLMNLQRNEEALEHLRSGSRLLPYNHHNEFLAFQYHALSNLGECFFKLLQPDSAIYYSEKAIAEARELGRNRGVALAYWNIGEAWLEKKDTEKAGDYCRMGYDLVANSQHRDVVQMICATYMKVYRLKENTDSLNLWLERGLAENLNPLNTDFSRITFLEQAIDMSVSVNAIERGTAFLRELNLLQRSVNVKEQSQRMAILKDYYEKNQKLIIADELTNAQNKELSLRKTISLIFGALALLLIFLIFIVMKTFKQRQRIAQLQYNEQLQNTSRDIELKALEKKMEALFTERNRISSDLHDDIGAALSSIRIYSGAAEKQFHNNPEESLQLIHRINVGSSGMMDRMSDIVWSISPKNDNVQSMVFRMKSHAAEILGPLDIKVNYEIDVNVEDIHPTIIARRNIYLIFKEAINNIAKYSDAESITVCLIIKDVIFHMHIDDDGKGFHVNQAQKGNGLVNMSNRSKAIDGNFHISSHAGRGTQLHFSVDIAKISDRNEA